MQAIAPAKINLALHVGGVRPDGYHPVDTVCAFLDIGETVRISGETSDFTLDAVASDGAALPLGGDNLILRGACAVADRVGATSVSFALDKRAPIASGIGAGTSDGAAAMMLMNARAGSPLGRDALMGLSEVLGADGPICMARQLDGGRLLRARGIGEAVSACPSVAPLWLCLANPRIPCPTGHVFRAFDAVPPPMPFDLPMVPRGATAQGLGEWIDRTRNDLAPPARKLVPVIAEVERQMKDQPGCVAGRMSGSGATVFGLFASATSAERASVQLRAFGWWTASGPAMTGGAA